jgi:alpha-glucoside transport system substrate-binding protein
MFTDPPGCSLEHQGSFTMGTYKSLTRNGQSLVPGKDFKYFPFPALAPVGDGAAEVSADLAAMFQPGDNARAFMKYLAGDEGQRAWPSRGGAFSANNQVLRDTANPVYTDDVSKSIAQSLTSEHTLCFDASDLMPATMSDAFSLAVLEFLGNPGSLDSLLGNLDKVRDNSRSDDQLVAACGR